MKNNIKLILLKIPDEKLWLCYRIQLLIDQGASPEKIVLGIPAYGRAWSIKGGSSMQPPVPAVGAAPAGKKGTLGYQINVKVVKICNLLQYLELQTCLGGS